MSPIARDSKKKEISMAKPALPQNEAALSGKEKKKAFFIVGMGGSAGSLEAFEEFFRNMPDDSGLAFVLISHLDPTHKGLMPELIQRTTTMKVVQVDDGMRVQPNMVYVIPPNKDMAILHGIIQLMEPGMPRGLRMPIDFFFRHLAEDQKEKSIGIIFSGMGTDGTIGLKAIKEKLGMAIVQDVSSSKYNGMPSSAINAGLADYIAPVSELPAKLMCYVSQLNRVIKKIAPEEKKIAGGLQKIFALIRAQTGSDFSLYKKSTIHRRIERRISVHQLNNINQYVRFLQENPHEVDLLFKELLIGVTSFFREQEAFEALKQKAVAKLLKNKQRGDAIRIWVVGCSTGEEAYSIAIVLRECIDDMKPKGNFKIQIYATDIDRDAINTARQGVYPANIATDISPGRLQRFFIKKDDHYRIKNEIRDTIIFAVQNVLSDPPFTKLDILSCRNPLIYLNAELQKKLLHVEETADEAKPIKSKASKSGLEAINSELEKELQYTKEHLRSVAEEMATSQEELKSSNEELQSTNEELQSTNEEQITSKEEMQSLNEELTTLNYELQSKNEELSEVNNNMKNLLNSMQVPTIFLDNNLKIKRFTPYATKIASLIQSDIGRPITDIVLNIQYEDLVKDMNEVLQTLVFKENQVSTKDGNWYLMRIIPYRTTQNIIDGLVITFSDITDLKKMSELMKARTEYAESIINTVREPMLVLSSDLSIVSTNPSFYRTFLASPEETEGKLLYNVGNGQWDIPALRKLLENVLPQNTRIEDFLVEHDFPGIGHRRMILNARKIAHDDPKKQLILLAMEDVTEHKEESKARGTNQ